MIFGNSSAIFGRIIGHENSILENTVKRLRNEDPVLIERIARDELNMIDKEEIVLIPADSIR